MPDLVLGIVLGILRSWPGGFLEAEMTAVDEIIIISFHTVSDAREVMIRRNTPKKANALRVNDCGHERDPDGAQEMRYGVATVRRSRVPVYSILLPVLGSLVVLAGLGF